MKDTFRIGLSILERDRNAAFFGRTRTCGKMDFKTLLSVINDIDQIYYFLDNYWTENV